MVEPKSFASLSSSLLARKGTAKPAMRPQGFAGFGPMTGTHDDLGWNDMGYDAQRPTPTEAVAGPVEVPQVVRQREELAEELGALQDVTEPLAPAQIAPIAVATVRPKKQMVISRAPETVAPKAKAAFTLRLDPERHLRLRLACAVGNRSAQQLVTEALDLFLETIPSLDDLAERVPARNAG